MAETKQAAAVPAERKLAKRTVIFRPPYTKKDGTASTIASCDVLGCFGSLPMAVKDFALSVPRNGQITVYMPSGMYGTSRVGPIGGELMSDADVAAEATTMQPDEARAFIARHRAKRASVEALADAIRGAWGKLSEEFPGTGATVPVERFGKPVVIELPE